MRGSFPAQSPAGAKTVIGRQGGFIAQDYIPRSDAKLTGWGQNLVEKVRKRGGHDGLSQPQFDELAAKLLNYKTAVDATADPASRTRPKVLEKDALKAIFIAVARRGVRVIQSNPATTDARRAELGLTVPKAAAPSPRRSMPRGSISARSPGER